MSIDMSQTPFFFLKKTLKGSNLIWPNGSRNFIWVLHFCIPQRQNRSFSNKEFKDIDKVPTERINRTENILSYTIPTSLRKNTIKSIKICSTISFQVEYNSLYFQKPMFSLFVKTIGICLNNKRDVETLSIWNWSSKNLTASTTISLSF